MHFILLDTGPMGDEPYKEATKALKLAIGKLRLSDIFGIYSFSAFDDNQIYFYSQTQLFTKEETKCFIARNWWYFYVRTYKNNNRKNRKI